MCKLSFLTNMLLLEVWEDRTDYKLDTGSSPIGSYLVCFRLSSGLKFGLVVLVLIVHFLGIYSHIKVVRVCV